MADSDSISQLIATSSSSLGESLPNPLEGHIRYEKVRVTAVSAGSSSFHPDTLWVPENTETEKVTLLNTGYPVFLQNVTLG